MSLLLLGYQILVTSSESNIHQTVIYLPPHVLQLLAQFSTINSMESPVVQYPSFAQPGQPLSLSLQLPPVSPPVPPPELEEPYKRFNPLMSHSLKPLEKSQFSRRTAFPCYCSFPITKCPFRIMHH